MSLGYAIYVSIVCTFVGWFAYGMFYFGFTIPVIAGPIVGLFLGDISVGIEIGGTLTLVYLGVVAVGAAIPLNQTTATTVATALAIVSNVDTSTAITLAVPVAVLGQLDRMVAWTLNSSLMHIADKRAEEDNLSGVERLSYVGSAIFWISEFIPVFLVIYFGAGFVENLNEIMPVWLTAWLQVATGMLPALGFGMLFTMMYKRNFLPYFIVGFVIAAYFEGNLQAVALFGVAAAMLHYFKKTREVV